MKFTNPNIFIASIKDSPKLNKLLNSAYRGPKSAKGWTTEAHLIAGNRRTSSASLKALMQLPENVILKYLNESNAIVGCVNLKLNNGKIYLGMLAVSPLLQAKGIGKQLLNAANEYAKSLNINLIYMTVISVRTELINWYLRHGYVNTGKIIPFNEDELSGKHLQKLHFLVLEKTIS